MTSLVYPLTQEVVRTANDFDLLLNESTIDEINRIVEPTQNNLELALIQPSINGPTVSRDGTLVTNKLELTVNAVAIQPNNPVRLLHVSKSDVELNPIDSQNMISAATSVIIKQLTNAILYNDLQLMLSCLDMIPIPELAFDKRQKFVLLIVALCQELEKTDMFRAFIRYFRVNQHLDENEFPESAIAEILCNDYDYDLLRFIWQCSDETFETVVISMLYWPMDRNVTSALGNLTYIYNQLLQVLPDTDSMKNSVAETMFTIGRCNYDVMKFVYCIYGLSHPVVPRPWWIIDDYNEVTELDEEELNYGPLSLPLEVSIERDVEWERQYRMLYDPDSWYTGVCLECKLRIGRYRYAVRTPFPFNGWDGCFCSWECVIDNLVPVNDDIIRGLIGAASQTTRILDASINRSVVSQTVEEEDNVTEEEDDDVFEP